MRLIGVRKVVKEAACGTTEAHGKRTRTLAMDVQDFEVPVGLHRARDRYLYRDHACYMRIFRSVLLSSFHTTGGLVPSAFCRNEDPPWIFHFSNVAAHLGACMWDTFENFLMGSFVTSFRGLCYRSRHATGEATTSVCLLLQESRRFWASRGSCRPLVWILM